MFEEFRKFIARGNVFELAVGIVIGAAFKSVVDSFVKDVLMPPVGMLMGDADFTDLFIALDGNEYDSLADATEAGAATLNYGLFINNVISFLIVAFAVFLMVRSYNRLQERWTEPPAEPAPTEKPCAFCRLNVPLEATRCPHCTSELTAAA